MGSVGCVIMLEVFWQLHISDGLCKGVELTGGGFVINLATPSILNFLVNLFI